MAQYGAAGWRAPNGGPQATATSASKQRPRHLVRVLAVVLAASWLLAGCQQTQASLETNLDDPTGYFTADSLHRFYDKRLTFDQYLMYALESAAHVAGFDNDIHRYDAKQDLINSFERNLTYSDDLGNLRANIDTSELSLLHDQSELTLIENELNQRECAKQLDLLFNESAKLFASSQTFSNSKQLDLIDFIDSFGSAPGSHLMSGNAMWLGFDEQCQRAKVSIKDKLGEQRSEPINIQGRYCVANLRSPNWPIKTNQRSTRLGSFSIKLGICLPKPCNSLSILRHSNRIETFVKLVRLQQVPLSSYRLTNLFCLPDEESPLRQLSLSAKCFLAVLTVWLLLVAYFSLKFEYASCYGLSKTRDEPSKPMQVFAFRLAWRKLFGHPEKDVQWNGALYEHNLINQMSTNQTIDQLRAISLDCASDKSSESSNGNNESFKQQIDLCLNNFIKNQKTANRSNSSKLKPLTGLVHEATTTNRINLAAIDGIKVISMIWLISAHTMLFFMRTTSNGRNFWSILLDARFMTIMAGIFPVDSFFTVTGVLTAYLKFNKNQGQAMRKLGYWLEAFVHRYLRFMPMYLLIFWYTRDVSEYIGQGPLWDYATADTSLRSMCKQESFSVPLLFQANFKPLDQHCVKPAWYLANDYQYLLITPIFIALLMCSKRLGYLAIVLSVLASLSMQFITVYYSKDFTDFEALINFRPMFATYVLKNLWRLYVLPYNRIAPYLLGLLTGHLMYSVSRPQAEAADDNSKTTKSSGIAPVVNSSVVESISSSSTSTSPSASRKGSSENIIAQKVSQTGSSENALFKHLNIRVWTPLILLISIIYLPMLTKLTNQEGDRAHVGGSLLIALMRFVWSLAIARLIYICATRPITKTDSFIIRFLSSPLWKPWSKIGLSVLLIQWEIISYFAQTQTAPPIVTISFLLAVVLVCIAATYALGLLVYLTIEHPLSQIEHLYIHPVLFGKKL